MDIPTKEEMLIQLYEDIKTSFYFFKRHITSYF